MKLNKYTLAILLLALFLSPHSILFSQVGINTTTPRKTLEVAGDMKVSNNLEVGNFNPLKDSNTSTFLIQNSGNSIVSMDASNPTGSALGYIQEYVITNPDLDWVFDFDTGVDATDYVMIAISANYDRELIVSNASGAENNGSVPYTATFVQGGTWHIIADFPMAANLNVAEIGTWTISTLIYSKDLSKQLGIVSIPMLNASTGSASSPIID